ncbi:hypothetical protein RhiirC2_711916 [Rhizophagus irregularis]|uniref:Uncharacterized protein n=1 Tax=Rhizophagus irregularis TaxID=588596 RepID=A0A2N1N923_9GLOM|nr:hypothetical protein RhiirC2_711916 [Rhizophagus irregularis]
MKSPSPSPSGMIGSEGLETEEQREEDFKKRWQEAREKALVVKKIREEMKEKIRENFNIVMGQCIGKVSSNIEGFEESGTREFERSSIEEFEGIGTKEPKGSAPRPVFGLRFQTGQTGLKLLMIGGGNEIGNIGVLGVVNILELIGGGLNYLNTKTRVVNILQAS